MKKLLILCVSITIFGYSQAQSFHKHAIVISADYGFEAYSLSQEYTVSGLNIDKTTSGATINSDFNFGAEFGLFNWLGVGLQGKLDNYSFSKDSTGFKPTAVGGEIGILVNIHILHIEKIDLMAGVNIGYSTITYTENTYNDQFYGNSLWNDVHVTFRYYLGRFGFNATAYLPFTHYTDMTSNNSDWASGQSVLNQWKSTGGGANIGIQFRFGVPKV